MERGIHTLIVYYYGELQEEGCKIVLECFPLQSAVSRGRGGWAS